jgi:hypothetical protein
MPRLQFTILSLLIAFAVFAAGLMLLIDGVRSTFLQDGPSDPMALCLLALGIALITASATIPFARPSVVVATSIVVTLAVFMAPFVLFWILIICGSLWQAAVG